MYFRHMYIFVYHFKWCHFPLHFSNHSSYNKTLMSSPPPLPQVYWSIIDNQKLLISHCVTDDPIYVYIMKHSLKRSQSTYPLPHTCTNFLCFFSFVMRLPKVYPSTNFKYTIQDKKIWISMPFLWNSVGFTKTRKIIKYRNKEK